MGGDLFEIERARPAAVYDPHSPDFEREEIADRRAVLRFFRAERRPVAVGGLVYDPVQGCHTRESDLAYVDGGWGWTTADAYLFRLYGLKLDPEFVRYAASAVANPAPNPSL